MKHLITPVDTPREDDDLDMAATPSVAVPTPVTQRGRTSPIRFATTTNAFGLIGSTNSTQSPPSTREAFHFNSLESDSISPTAGAIATRRMRRPSMLSLAQTASFASDSSLNSEEITARGPGPPREELQNPSSSQNRFTNQPTPKWSSAAFTMHEALRRTTSAPLPSMEGVSKKTPPIPQVETMEAVGSESQSSMDLEGIDGEGQAPNRGRTDFPPLSNRRKEKARMVEGNASPHPKPLRAPSLTGRPLPAPLLATLLSESSHQEHEMRSEARLQRLLSSHPHALPLTPRAPRSSRGRFPEMVGGDDDDDDNSALRRSSWARTSWMNRASSSDSDSDDLPMEDPPETVNAAFAAGMDMDRPTSSSSSCVGVESGKSTPGHSTRDPVIHAQPTPPQQSVPWTKNPHLSFGSAGAGMVPSPGSGLFLPTAFGGLGMGGAGTPLNSPTVERLEVRVPLQCRYDLDAESFQLAGSPSAISVSSPGLMHYRESQGGSASSVRPGKRKGDISPMTPFPDVFFQAEMPQLKAKNDLTPTNDHEALHHPT